MPGGLAAPLPTAGREGLLEYPLVRHLAGRHDRTATRGTAAPCPSAHGVGLSIEAMIGVRAPLGCSRDLRPFALRCCCRLARRSRGCRSARSRTLTSPVSPMLVSGATNHPARRSCAPPSTHPLTILALSGGGAEGAYGAGFLKGWSQTGNRPRFDIVTGTSVGSLMAPFAFLGPDYDDVLESFFTSGLAQDLLKIDGVNVLFGAGAFKSEPLKEPDRQIRHPGIDRCDRRRASQGPHADDRAPPTWMRNAPPSGTWEPSRRAIVPTG